MNSPKFADHYVNVKGFRTRYWDVGFSDSVVILVHGFNLSCEVWEHNIADLAKTHRVIALDFWGSGQTDANPKKIGLFEYPEFLMWFMEALKIKKAKLVGHSLGGLMALKTAHDYPDTIEKLMLVGSAGFTVGLPLHFRLLVLPFLGELMIKPNRAGLKHAFTHNLYNQKSMPESYIDSLFEYSKKPYAGEHALNMARSGITPFGFRRSLIRSVKSDAQQIQCPTLIVWGKNDRIVHHRGAFRAKKLIPHARLEVLDNCGHIPQMEYPAQFNSIAHSFL